MYSYSLESGSKRIVMRPLVALITLCAASMVQPARANGDTTTKDVQFDSQFLLGPDGRSIDVSRFEKGNPVVPGQYLVDVIVNGNWVGRQAVKFGPRNGLNAALCFDRKLAERIGLNFDVLSPENRARLASASVDECLDLRSMVGDASVDFDPSDLRLDLTVPQVAVKQNPQGYVSPELWDAGVPSATLAYNFTGSRSTGGESTDSQGFLGLNAGVNVGSWHFRHNGSMSWSTGRTREYQSIVTYLQHDVPSLRSQVKIGDTYTDGQFFDSFGVRGIQLATDDQMLPESMRGYAPVIRGVANSNARVTVTQNGIKLYETIVSPGAFEIKDLYATGYGGNLLVTITEADGSQRSFAVPYASVVQLLRPGIYRVTASAGELRDQQITSKVKVVQSTVQRGFTNLLTGYTGAILAQNYYSALVGVAVNTDFGAVAFDVTHAHAEIGPANNSSGQSFRVSFSKSVPVTQTLVNASASRYSSSGFWTFRDAMLARQAIERGNDIQWTGRPRSRLQISLSQSFGQRWGTVYISGNRVDYWGRGGNDTFYNAGYSNSFRSIGYSVSVLRQRVGTTSAMSNQIFASISVPLGGNGHTSTLTTTFTRDDEAGSTLQAMYNGSAGDYNEFNYGLSATRARPGSSADANAQYASPYTTISGGVSRGNGYSRMTAGLSGAVVAHPGGVTLAPSMGDTVGVIDAPDAAGARVENAPGVAVDGLGYAIVPFLTPYSLNTVSLDPRGLPLDVQLDTTAQQIAPRANSVVMLHFKTTSGRTALVTVHLPNGKSPPFGAAVQDEKGSDIGIIGQGGKFFLQGATDSGRLTVKWGNAPDETCEFSYSLPPRDRKQLVYTTLDSICTAKAPRTEHVTEAAHIDGSPDASSK